ncbi:MAG: hypothetical protein ABI551_02735 [Polyangiaceae bacterium]
MTFAATGAWGCNMLSGLDSLQESAVGADDEAGTLLDSGIVEVGESGVVGGPGTSDCTPDPDYCNTHCGKGTDNCGQPRTCSDDCGQNAACDSATHTCQCTVASNYCAGRCHTSTDNCGKSEDCGECAVPTDGGVAQCSVGGACGCDPDPIGKVCAGRACGSVINNCKQTVYCGGGGTSACSGKGQVCESNGACCTPDNATACAGKCNTTAVNNCGQTVSCPGSCTAGQVCSGVSCCSPEPISTTCGASCGLQKTNNCGQTVNCGCNLSQVCSSGACCTPNKVTCGAKCSGSVTDNCGQTFSCTASCDDICLNGGTCLSTGSCNCRCDNGQLPQSNGLTPQMMPTCLPY